MKRLIVIGLLLFSLLTGSVTTVRALDGLVTLKETRNDPGGGVIFVFTYTGEFPSSYFKGFVTAGDKTYPIDCNVAGDGVVNCTTTRAVAGQNVVLFLGEFVFWTFVPEGGFLRATNQPTYCYNVYDYFFDESQETTEWYSFDVHCQNEPAQGGDLLENFYNPDYNDYFDYEFMDQSPSCFNTVNEAAYYYPSCPS